MTEQRFIKPPFVQNPEDSYSHEFRVSCMAWWLITHKKSVDLEAYLRSQKPRAVLALRKEILRCKAWIWLTTMTNQDIHRALLLEPENVEGLRDALNALRPFLKQYTSNVDLEPDQ